MEAEEKVLREAASMEGNSAVHFRTHHLRCYRKFQLKTCALGGVCPDPSWVGRSCPSAQVLPAADLPQGPGGCLARGYTPFSEAACIPHPVTVGTQGFCRLAFF